MLLFQKNIPGLQVFWPTGDNAERRIELEIIQIPENISDGATARQNVAIGLWANRKYYYRYPVDVLRTDDKLIISNYQRPPEWPSDNDWYYIPGTLTVKLKGNKPLAVKWRPDATETNNQPDETTLTEDRHWKYFQATKKPLEPRGTIRQERKARPEQQIFRKLLLAQDGRCVISGCEIEACLEACHILPVENGGIESLDNMILLRADLHRLFDAGLLFIEVPTPSAPAQFWAMPDVKAHIEAAIRSADQKKGFSWAAREPALSARLNLQRRADGAVELE